MSVHTDPSLRHSGAGHINISEWLRRAQERDAVTIECSEDPAQYADGHVPGALNLDWRRLPRHGDHCGFASLAGSLGITPLTTVIFYGDRFNWRAAYAAWLFHLHGHERTLLLDGGRERWIQSGRPLELVSRTARPQDYRSLRERRSPVFADFEQTLSHVRRGLPLIDVRSPAEYAGELSHPPEYPEEAPFRSGAIPGAISLPWSLSVTESGTFKSRERLREIYEDVHGLRPDNDIIVYCRIGERSSHTWFTLTRLLGFKRVRNYTGGWREWSFRHEQPLPVRR